ncbi:MAG: hypothetical protein JXB05_20860 [Myxococcaceae bacterium]|nr:hypothetical protein [Myxococcaceae bacterium]
MSVGEPVSRSEPMSRERVFISGSLVNLRETASTKALVVKQVPIGTGCLVEEKADSGWWRIGCGDSQGWAKAELLSAERPTLEPLLAMAQDSKQPLKDRFDAALRATALDPEHADARNLLWSLFAEQEWAQLDRLLTQETGRLPQSHISVECGGESSTETCLMNAFEPRQNALDHLKKHLKIHNSERLAKSLFVMAVLEKPFGETKPLQLRVRTGTFDGDSKELDIQVFAESRYVPSDALKSALEKLPENREGGTTALVPERHAVLSSEERSAVRQLAGRWGQVRRESQGLVFWYDCYGNDGIEIHIELLGERVGVRLESNDIWEFDVGGVRLAEDGSITLRMLTGETLKHTRSRDDKRVSHWTGLMDSFGLVDGLFVHSDEKDAFPVVGPGPGECGDDGPP